MNSLVKAAMSLCQFLFPFWVASVSNARLTAIILAVALFLDILLVMWTPFAPHDESKKTEPKAEVKQETTTRFYNLFHFLRILTIYSKLWNQRIRCCTCNC